MTHPARVVGATDTQLFILRTQVRALCDSSSEVRKKSSVFGKADLEASDGEPPYPTLTLRRLLPLLTLRICICMPLPQCKCSSSSIANPSSSATCSA